MVRLAVLDSGPADEATLPVSSLGSANARIVLCRLAFASPLLVRSDELADALWPGPLPKTWDTMVRGAVARVRRWFAKADAEATNVVLLGDAGYRLVLPPGWTIDVHEARRALAAAEAAVRAHDSLAAAKAADEAARIAVGHELLADLDNEWLHGARRSLVVLGIDALQIGASSELALGHHRRAAVLARQLIALEPFGEAAHQVLMQALAAQGERARALQVFDELRVLLGRELGVAPSIETEALHRTLRTPTQPADGVDPLDAAQLGVAGMIGRGPERARLDAAWKRARAGRLAVALVSGEAGIGKTTLVLDAAHQAWVDGATVLIGHCSVHAATAYEPFAEAIAAHVATVTDHAQRRRHLDAGGPALSWLVPSIAGLVGEIRPSADPDRDRLRLFEAVAAYIGALAASGPTVMVLDDVQWAGTAVLGLLDHLFRRLATAPVLIVMTERRPDSASSGLTAALSAWRRDPGLAEITLGGWSADEVTAYVSTAGGADVTRAGGVAVVAERLHRRAGGNPYFVSELLRVADRTGPVDDIPRGIIDIVERHCEASGADALALMQALAIIGADAGPELLRRVVRFEPDRFLDAVDSALATGLVRERPERAGRLGFAHALAGDAVAAGIPTGQRIRLHGHIADELQRQRDQGAIVSSAVLAHHFASALDRSDLAVAHALDAARSDLTAGARDEAAARLRAALALDPPDRLRCDVLVMLGTTLAQQGEGAESRRAFLDAARLAAALGDGTSLATAALGLTMPGRGVTTWVTDAVSVELLERALTVLGTSEDALRVRVLGALSDAIVDPDSWAQRQQLAEDAVAIAERSTDPAAMTAALAAVRIARWRPEQTEARLAAVDRVLAIATAHGDDETAATAALARMADLIVIGDRTRVDEAVALARVLVDRVGLVRYEWEFRLIEVGLLLADGALSAGQDAAHKAFALWGSDDQPDATRAFAEQAVFTMIAAADADGLGQILPDIVEAADRIAAYRCMLPVVLSVMGRFDEARVEIERIADAGYRAVPAHSSWLFAMCALADAASVVGSAATIAHLRDALAPHRGRMPHLEGPSLTSSCVDLRLGRLAFAAGDLAEAEALLRSALAQHRSFGNRIWAWHTLVSLAAVLRSSVVPASADEADRLVAEAAAQIEALNLPGLSQLVDPLLLGPRPHP